MKEVNAEYDSLFFILKDVHSTKDGDIYTSRESNNETADQFKDLVSELMKMDNIVIEVIGCFVWLSGNTKPYSEKLKSMKFQWHSKKMAWYLKPDAYTIQSRREYSMEEIRSMYGSSGAMNSTGSEEGKVLSLKLKP
ncbi:MAG: hypothetical protein LBH09_07070 [Peptococcaceae bacterium]|jgi:hypothetical protein|nr:hypothetical protein [Peptococcaceae bacterium]